MRRLCWLVTVSFVLSGLAGCAGTKGPPFEDLQDDLPPLEAGEGRIFIYLMDYPGSNPCIRVDGDRMGTLLPMTFFMVDVPAGTHEVRACRGRYGFFAADRFDVPVSAGQTRYVEAVGVDPHARLLLTDPSDGAKTIQKCRYKGPELSDEDE